MGDVVYDGDAGPGPGVVVVGAARGVLPDG